MFMIAFLARFHLRASNNEERYVNATPAAVMLHDKHNFKK
jgi:hypothetical protein